MTVALVCGGGLIGGHLVKRLKAGGMWVCAVGHKFAGFSATEVDDFIVEDLSSRVFGRAMQARTHLVVDRLNLISHDDGSVPLVGLTNALFEADPRAPTTSSEV